MTEYVPICGRCGSMFVHHDSYEATAGYGGTAGCQNCNPTIKSDRQRRVEALEAIERVAANALATDRGIV